MEYVKIVLLCIDIYKFKKRKNYSRFNGISLSSYFF